MNKIWRNAPWGEWRSQQAWRAAGAALLLLGVVLSSPGCVGGRERSVKPGINDSYKQDPDIEKWKGRFEVESREIYAQRHRIVEETRIAPGMDVADIGSGTGLYTGLLAKAVSASGSVVAVDIIPEFLESVRQRNDEAGITNVRYVRCREDSVDLPPASIDLAFICDVYHHFEYPMSSLASLHEALRPGGEVILIDFKRIPGVTREWVMGHVRAGREIVTSEFQRAGFELVGGPIDVEGLTENYMLRFRKIELSHD